MNSSLELLYLIIFSGILAVGYSYLLSGQILSSSAGNEKMREIAENGRKKTLNFFSYKKRCEKINNIINQNLC